MYLGKIILVTGWRMAGKTTFCKEVIRSARQKGLQVRGLLSSARFEDNIKVGIDVEDLASQDKRILAEFNQGQKSDITTKSWVFDINNMVWGNNILKNINTCDFFVIDELGPLEFCRNQGWTAGFDVLDARNYQLALVVIRPELIEEAKIKWPDAPVIQIESVSEVKSLMNNFIKEHLNEIIQENEK